jgi:ribosomal protein S10
MWNSMVSMPFGAYDYTPHGTKESFEIFDMTQHSPAVQIHSSPDKHTLHL